MKSIIRKLLLSIVAIALIILIKSTVYGASVSISAPSTTYVNQPCTITITGTGAATYDIVANVSGAGVSSTINLNAFTDDLSNGTKSTSVTVTPKSTGTISVSIAPSSNVTVAGGTGSQPVSAPSKSIQVTTKLAQSNTATTTKKPTTTTKAPTTSTTPKTTTKKEEKKEEKKDDFYITFLSLKGIKENDEKVSLELSPEFEKDVYEYSCTVPSDVQKLELEKDVGDYEDKVTVTGLEELKEGENVITVKLEDKDQPTRTYTIKVTKEAMPIETTNEQEEQTTENEEDKAPIMVSMPLGAFIAMQLGIIVVELIMIKIVKKVRRRYID